MLILDCRCRNIFSTKFKKKIPVGCFWAFSSLYWLINIFTNVLGYLWLILKQKNITYIYQYIVILNWRHFVRMRSIFVYFQLNRRDFLQESQTISQ